MSISLPPIYYGSEAGAQAGVMPISVDGVGVVSNPMFADNILLNDGTNGVMMVNTTVDSSNSSGPIENSVCFTITRSGKDDHAARFNPLFCQVILTAEDIPGVLNRLPEKDQESVLKRLRFHGIQRGTQSGLYGEQKDTPGRPRMNGRTRVEERSFAVAGSYSCAPYWGNCVNGHHLFMILSRWNSNRREGCELLLKRALTDIPKHGAWFMTPFSSADVSYPIYEYKDFNTMFGYPCERFDDDGNIIPPECYIYKIGICATLSGALSMGITTPHGFKIPFGISKDVYKYSGKMQIAMRIPTTTTS